jgi:hypothetical protein
MVPRARFMKCLKQITNKGVYTFGDLKKVLTLDKLFTDSQI